MPIDKTQVATTIDRLLETEFEIDPELLKPENHLFQVIGLDSLDLVDLIFALQKAFSLHIREDSRAREVRTLANLHELILTILEEQEQAASQ